MVSSSSKKVKSVFSEFVWIVMAFSALASILSIGSFPLVKTAMVQYRVPETTCINGKCTETPICVINGTTLGSDFPNVDNYYTFPISSCALIANVLLVMRIFGSRFINSFLSTFAFFCLIVFPIRFTFLAMQTLEFTTIGGDYYTMLLLEPDQFECPLFSKYADAVFFMHLRFLLLVVDFLTFHALIVSVPLFYVDDKLQTEKYEIMNDEKVPVFAHPASTIMFEKV